MWRRGPPSGRPWHSTSVPSKAPLPLPCTLTRALLMTSSHSTGQIPTSCREEEHCAYTISGCAEGIAARRLRCRGGNRPQQCKEAPPDAVARSCRHAARACNTVAYFYKTLPSPPPFHYNFKKTLPSPPPFYYNFTKTLPSPPPF